MNLKSRLLGVCTPIIAIGLGGCFTCPDVVAEHSITIDVLDPQNTLPEEFVATLSASDGTTWTTETQQIWPSEIESGWRFVIYGLSTSHPIPKIDRVVIEDLDGTTLVDETIVQKTTKASDSCGSYSVGKGQVDLSE